MTEADPTSIDIDAVTQRLLERLGQAPSDQYRHALIAQFTQRLGNRGYPVFLKVLLNVADGDNDIAKRLLNQSLAYALQRLDLPAGELNMWGSSVPVSAPAHLAAALEPAKPRRTPQRFYGPIEYLTVWHGQRTQRLALTPLTYENTLAKLLTLFNESAEVRQLYPLHLRSQLSDELEGLYTRDSRERLTELAEDWARGLAPADIAHRAAATRATPFTVHRL